MTEFIWSFSLLKVAQSQGDLADVVVGVRYRLCCTDSERAAYASGDVTFAPADPAAFVEFNAITKDAMIAFVEQSLGVDTLDAIKASLEQELLNPIEIKPLPWESQAEAIE